MKKIVRLVLKFLLWLVFSLILSSIFNLFVLEFVYILFCLITVVLLWLLIFNKNIKSFYIILGLFMTYFLIYFLVPSKECGDYYFFYPHMDYTCDCSGLKKYSLFREFFPKKQKDSNNYNSVIRTDSVFGDIESPVKNVVYGDMGGDIKCIGKVKKF